jgi:hypothetical protein
MTDYEQFAKALAEALGPIYRVSLVEVNGRIIASFGSLVGEAATRADVALPDWAGSLRLEVDSDVLQGMSRALRSLSRKPSDTRDGTFTHLDRALDELIILAEAEIGQPIQDMTRMQKRRLVRLLDERGAFALRKSVETVAELLGVTRFTVYNYLDAVRSTHQSR